MKSLRHPSGIPFQREGFKGSLLVKLFQGSVLQNMKRVKFYRGYSPGSKPGEGANQLILGLSGNSRYQMGAKAKIPPFGGPFQSLFHILQGMSPAQKEEPLLLGGLDAQLKPHRQPSVYKFLKKSEESLLHQIWPRSQSKPHHGKMWRGFFQGGFDMLPQRGKREIRGGVALKVENSFLCLETVLSHPSSLPNLFLQRNSPEERPRTASPEVAENTSPLAEVFPMRTARTQIQGYLVNPGAKLLPKKGGPLSIGYRISQEKPHSGVADGHRAFHGR
jgi:hypothetical protein